MKVFIIESSAQTADGDWREWTPHGNVFVTDAQAEAMLHRLQTDGRRKHIKFRLAEYVRDPDSVK